MYIQCFYVAHDLGVQSRKTEMAAAMTASIAGWPSGEPSLEWGKAGRWSRELGGNIKLYLVTIGSNGVRGGGRLPRAEEF